MKRIVMICLLGLLALTSCENGIDSLTGHKFMCIDGNGDSLTLSFYRGGVCEVIGDVASVGYIKTSEFDYTFHEPNVRIYYNRSLYWKEEAWGKLFLEG